MGTNYYADWRLSDGHTDSPWSINLPPTTMRMHICKSLTSWQGGVFVSWVAWRHFLLTNRWAVTIVDEYDREHDIDQFIRDVESTTRVDRERQHVWMQKNMRLPDGQTTDWMDPDGFSFHSGEFS